MKCEDFQRSLPDFMEGGGSAEGKEHLQGCDKCAGLVEDLKYIAEAAKLLLPMHEPSERVWEGIERGMGSNPREPKARSARGTARQNSA